MAEFHKSTFVHPAWARLALCYPYTDREVSFAFKYNQWMMAKLRERGRETDARRGLLGNIGSLVTPCHGVTRVTGLRSDVGSLVRVIREGGPGEMMCQHRESAATLTRSL